jgi:hypothetical protein
MAIEFIDEEQKGIIYTNKAHDLIKEYVIDNNDIVVNFKLIDLKDKDTQALFEFVGKLENASAVIYEFDSFDSILDYKFINSLSVNENTAKGNKKPSLDLSNFPYLTYCSIDWNPKISNIGALHKLRQLNLFQYKPKSKDLTELSTLESLKNLKLGSGNYESLKGLDNLKNLKELRLYSNRSVKTDKTIILKSVESLYISSCKSYDHNFYKSFPNLKTLDLESSNDLESLKPILDSLRYLKEINICGTKVLEEDNSYWKGYENITMLNFNNRKHHKLKTKDFENYPYDKNGKWKGIPRTIIE